MAVPAALRGCIQPYCAEIHSKKLPSTMGGGDFRRVSAVG